LKQSITGIARIIEYKEYESGGDSYKYITRMWEGEIERGEPNGFNRFIDGITDYSFLGYSVGSTRSYGTCLIFENK